MLSMARKGSLGNLQSFFILLLLRNTSLNSAAGTATNKAELGHQVPVMRTQIHYYTHKTILEAFSKLPNWLLV